MWIKSRTCERKKHGIKRKNGRSLPLYEIPAALPTSKTRKKGRKQTNPTIDAGEGRKRKILVEFLI